LNYNFLSTIPYGIFIRIVKAAYSLPLEQNSGPISSSDSLEDNAEQLLGDPTLEMNRITQLKAKLEYRFDCTNHKYDDILLPIEQRKIADNDISIEDVEGTFVGTNCTLCVKGENSVYEDPCEVYTYYTRIYVKDIIK
jgi:hypothetical protein